MRQLGMVAILVLCVCAASFGAIELQGAENPRTLVYNDPADLDTVIDPPGLGEVGPSLGVGLDKAAFQALNPQVVGFNAPTASFLGQLGQLVVNYSATGTVTFTFPTPDKFDAVQPGEKGYNYGGSTSAGKQAFSGTLGCHDISTVPSTTDDGSLFNYFDAKITTTGGKGVGAIGFCVYTRSSITVPASPMTITLSDDSVVAIDMPATGLNTPYLTFFFGYQAPVGKTIKRIEASHAPLTGGGQAYQAIDDLSFVMVDDGSVQPLIGDINKDGFVNVGDLQALVAAWGSQETPPSANWNADADINDDGFVNVGDLQLLVAHWGESQP